MTAIFFDITSPHCVRSGCVTLFSLVDPRRAMLLCLHHELSLPLAHVSTRSTALDSSYLNTTGSVPYDRARRKQQLSYESEGVMHASHWGWYG